MEQKLKTANILSVLLACIFALSFLATVFINPVYSDSGDNGTEVTSPIDEVGGGSDVEVTPDDAFEAAPRLNTAFQAWKYAETKLYELSHWESLIRNHEIRPDKPMSGQTIRTYKSFSGQQNSFATYSAIFLPGAVIGRESYTYLENKGGIITKRETPNQTSKREPIWGSNEKTWVWTEAEYLAINGSLPFMPGYIITLANTTNGSSRPINDGSTITFSLGLKKAALEYYIMQVNEASDATAGPFFKDGGVTLEVVLNAKTGMFISMRTVEEYDITVMGIKTFVRATRTEEFFNFVK